MIRMLLLTSLICLCYTFAYGSIQAVPENLKQEIIASNWRADCPVSLDDLVYIRLSYWGFDNQVHVGEIIVHKRVANDVQDIFQTLYQQHFPIQRMQVASRFNGEDRKMMIANNTSAFNCRTLMYSHRFSHHSYGVAIDLNPVQNPYLVGHHVFPPAGKKYLSRQDSRPGMITRNSLPYRLFKQHGWQWGGNWQSSPDYQHFEKM